MTSDHLVYLQEIPNASWVLELISEQFDNAVNMMTPNSIVYGGAVRDCLAGKKLIGDLDIAVPSTEYNQLANKFLHSPKWISVHNIEYAGLFINKKDKCSIDLVTAMSFQTLGDKKVQLITPRVKDGDPFTTVIQLAKQVDIVCCGVMLTYNGRVFEVVKGAYEDCKNNVLCLNKPANVTTLDRFQERIEKFVGRGWDNKIDMAQATRVIKRNQRQQKKLVPEKPKKVIEPDEWAVFNYSFDKSTPAKHNRFHHTLSSRTLRLFGGLIGGLINFSKGVEEIAKKYALNASIYKEGGQAVLVTNSQAIDQFIVHKLELSMADGTQQ